MNQVTLVGRIGQTPELITTKSGVAVTEFSVATSNKYKDAAGELKEDTQWHRVIAWRGRAEAIAKFFNKGDQIILQGELRYEKWEKDGQKHTTAKVHVSTFEFGESRKSKAEEPPKPEPYQGKDFSDVMGGAPISPAPIDESPAF